jgi:Na+-translocating ferredoxin:NAD+ oxidoreductase RNF subunit RnfB
VFNRSVQVRTQFYRLHQFFGEISLHFSKKCQGQEDKVTASVLQFIAIVMSRKNKSKKSEIVSSPPPVSTPETTQIMLKETEINFWQELKECRESCADGHKETIAKISEAFNKVETGMLRYITDLFNELKTEINDLRCANNQMAAKVENLEQKVNRLEQEKLNNCMEIKGLDAKLLTPTKPLKTIVCDLFTSQSIPHKPENIDSIQVREVKNETDSHQLLTVAFTSYDEKIKIMKSKCNNDKG